MVGARALGPYVVAVQLTEQFGALPVALITSLAPVLAVSVGPGSALSALSQAELPISDNGRLLPVRRDYADHETTDCLTVREGVSVLGRSDKRTSLVGGAAFSRCRGYSCSYRKKISTLFPIFSSCRRDYEHWLNLVFIPHWGALGASWATVISYTFAAILMYLAFQPSRADRLGRPLHCGAAVLR